MCRNTWTYAVCLWSALEEWAVFWVGCALYFKSAVGNALLYMIWKRPHREGRVVLGNRTV